MGTDYRIIEKNLRIELFKSICHWWPIDKFGFILNEIQDVRYDIHPNVIFVDVYIHDRIIKKSFVKGMKFGLNMFDEFKLKYSSIIEESNVA